MIRTDKWPLQATAHQQHLMRLTLAEYRAYCTGKQYNCDLNASYNIAARYWAWKLKLTRRKDGQLPEDKSSPANRECRSRSQRFGRESRKPLIYAQHDEREHSRQHEPVAPECCIGE